MPEIIDRRVLGAIRWIDAVTLAPIALPLKPTSDQLRFSRNLSGLTVITEADGLEAYVKTFDLATLAPADVVATGSVTVEGTVEDPSGTYLPAKFTVPLPRDPSPTLIAPDNHRPAGSLFTPLDVALLPAPAARLAPGTAQVRVLILDPAGQPIRNALARVVSTTSNAILGCGLSDARGETLVAIPGLKHFGPGATAEAVVSVETEARLEVILPPANSPVVDWIALRNTAVAAGNTDAQPLRLRPGALISRRFPFTT